MASCITCHLAFSDREITRIHYKSDWHRYNLKRKTVKLPPISAEEFRKKVESQQALDAKTKENEKVVAMTCKVCTRQFRSYGSYTAHLKSKKHLAAEKKELESVRKRVEDEQALDEDDFEKDEDVELEKLIEMEEKKINKALAEAKENLNQPILFKGENKRKKMREAIRIKWCETQMKLVAAADEEVEDEKEEDGDEDEEWEDMSDDDDESWEEVDQEEETDDDEKETTSENSESSDVTAIMSRMKHDSDADVSSIGSRKVQSPQHRIGLLECLFCPRVFATVEDKVIHMSRQHSFFIPELQYCSNLDGLLKYIGYKIGVANVCIWCNKKFWSLTAVRSHMCDVGHCRMLVEKDAVLEYADFYDFSTSYPDHQEADADMQLMEVDEVESSGESGDGEEEYELVLPSGARIGNRKLKRYYRQKFPTVDRGLTMSTNTNNNGDRVRKLLSQYSSAGWKSAGALSAAVKTFRRDINYVQHMKKKHAQKLGMKNNKTMMKHFRCSVMF